MKKPGNAGGAKARQEGGCVESMTKQEELSKVEETPKQGREAESQKWSWVEAEVWTERMLTTLETGVKGGKWFSLIDKVYRNRSLEAAWRKVRRRKGAGGVDGQSIQKFEWRLERELEQLHQELKDDRYQPRAVRRHWIDKGGGKKRPLGIPTVADIPSPGAGTNLRKEVLPAQLWIPAAAKLQGCTARGATTTGRRLSLGG